MVHSCSYGPQDFPDHWVNNAIPYGQLKKCLKKVQRELHDLGLDPDTLRALLDPNTASPVALQYKLNGIVTTRGPTLGLLELFYPTHLLT